MIEMLAVALVALVAGLHLGYYLLSPRPQATRSAGTTGNLAAVRYVRFASTTTVGSDATWGGYRVNYTAPGRTS